MVSVCMICLVRDAADGRWQMAVGLTAGRTQARNKATIYDKLTMTILTPL